MKSTLHLDRYTRRDVLKTLGTFFALPIVNERIWSASYDVATRPNVVLLVADDLGWSDVGCMGNRFIDTPNIDRLASDGMLFTNAYAPAPICSATRAAILTGKSPARLHFEFVSKDKSSKPLQGTKLIQPPFTEDLPLEELTFAEVLSETGYVTGMFGKWHLTQRNDRYLGWGDTHGPLQQGFMFGSEDRGSHPYSYKERTFGKFEEGQFPEDSLIKSSIDFIQRNSNRPFLMYLPLYYVHTPVHTRCKWLYDKYAGRLEQNANADHIMYAAFVETMDHYIGQVLGAINNLGLTRNTIVMFTSDNGGHPQYTDNSPLNGSKWNLYEGGIRVPMVVRWPGVVQRASKCNIPVIGTDLFPTLCEIARAEKNPKIPLDGVSFVPLQKDPSGGSWQRDTLYWHFPYYHPPYKGGESRTFGTTPQSAMRKGNYKLLYRYETSRTELFDLSSDISEQHDISQKLPERTTALKGELMDHLKTIDARFPKKRP